MKIAITGANGFVGSTLINYLHQKGFEPVALTRKSFAYPSIPVRIVDYDDPESLHNAIADADVVIHNAGMTKSFKLSEMLAANVGLTRNIVSAINRVSRPIRFIYISSQAVAGPSSASLPASESDPPNPISIYGKSKLIAERLVQSQCQKPWNIVRPCSVYGPGDRDFLSLFKLCQMRANIRIGKTDRPLNMIHVEQLADFLLHLITNQQVAGEIFFATDNQVYTQSMIAEQICAAMGRKAHKLVIPQHLARITFSLAGAWSRIRQIPSAMNPEKFKELSAEGWVANPDKAIRLLGWNPSPMMPELIKETYTWYLENSWL